MVKERERKIRRHSIMIVLCMLFVMDLGFARPSLAGTGDGTYVGATINQTTVNNDEFADFDGESVLIGYDELILVPELENGMGWGVVLGRKKGRFAWEIAYERSKHGISFLGIKGEDATLQHFDINLKLHLLKDTKIQPYLQIGWIPYSWLTVKDASANSSLEVGDAKFVSPFGGFNAGGGIAIYLIPHVAITAGAVYQYISFSTAEGVNNDATALEDRLSLKGMVYQAGVMFIF